MNNDVCSYLFSALVLIIGVACLPLTSAAQGDAGTSPVTQTVTKDDTDTLPIAGTVLIRNVTLIDQSGKKKDVVINILIRDKKLDLVTKEEISVDSAELAFDAQKGFLLGKIKLGEPPNFMILNRDPREDIDALLDTKKHARFAVRKGEIVFNRLQLAFEVKEKPKRSGWLAYSPPPVTLSTSYDDASKWNRWDTKYFSGIFIGALALDHQYWLSQNSASETSPIGNLNDFTSGEIRALRFGVVGRLNFPQPWVYNIMVATNAFGKGFNVDTSKNIAFFDLRLDIPTFAETTLSIGKQKEPISMERIMGMVYLPMQERSAVSDALLPSRNVGIVLSGTGFEQRMTWAGGAFNDWLESGDSFNEGASQFIGRVTWLPLVSEDESNLLHLGLGLRYSNTKQGMRAATEPEFNNSPVFVDTGFFDADSTMAYNLETSWRKGPFWLAGEYVLSDIDAPAVGNPDFTGFHVTASWILTGEMRGYNRKSGVFRPIEVAKSVYQGGVGAWEVSARWSEIDLTDGLVTGGEMKVFSLGLNWFLSQEFNVSLNYRFITLDRFGVKGESSGINTRIVLFLQ